MLTVLHPLLLWGTALIAVPVLIHLLLRQRPRPRAWAAMRWLLAAAKAAERRWRLTNLLLLLLRCLAVVLIALALARPSLAGLGGGDHLLIVVDGTASMGPRSGDPGTLAAVAAALAKHPLPWRAVSVVAIEDAAVVVAERMAPAAALAALAGRPAAPLPGGLDDALDRPGRDRLESLASGADALLISDFQHDDGARLAAALSAHARSLTRWAVSGSDTLASASDMLVSGSDTLASGRETLANAGLGGAEPADPLPGQAGELLVRTIGQAGAVLVAVDDGSPLAAPATTQGDHLRLVLPPLGEGPHRLRLKLVDGGLIYDDTLELPLMVRSRMNALLIHQRTDFAVAALRADDRGFTATSIGPAGLSAAVLPEPGAVVLRGRVADGARLRDWVRSGGVLWISAADLLADPVLAELAPGLAAGEPVAGGAWASGDREVDEVLSLAGHEPMPGWSLPPGATPLLSAGKAPAVIELAVGRGAVAVELLDLATDAAFTARATVPLWVVRAVRRMAARSLAPLEFTAGTPWPTERAEFRLVRGQVDLKPAAGAPLLAAPGLWSLVGADGLKREAIILPDPTEGRVGREPPVGAERTLNQALPVRAGSDLGVWLLVAALAVILIEGAFAAWAGRMYGR